MRMFLISFLIASQAWAGLPPTTVKGQSETSAVTTFNIQAPYNLATTTSSVTRLIESGNNNLLANPSFEHSTATTSWTSSVGSAAAETTNIHNGKKSLALTLSSASGSFASQDVTPTIQMSGSNMEHSIWVKTSVTTTQVCARNAAATVGTCVAVQGDSIWHQYVVNYPGPASGSVGVSVETTSSTTGTVYVDEAYVGFARNIGTGQQTNFVGSLKYLGTTSCQWTSASTSLANFAADTDCPTASVTGTVTAPGTKIPGAVVPNLAPGTYKVTVKTNISKTGTADAIVGAAISDGTTASPAQNAYANTTNGAYGFPLTLVGYFTYTTAQSSVTFQVQGVTNSGSNAVAISANFANQADFEIAIEYIPSQNQQAVRVDQSNFDWTACPSYTLSWTANTASTCKRRRSGSSAFYDLNITLTNAPTSASLTMTLPSDTVIDTTKLAGGTASNQYLGGANLVSASTGYFGEVRYSSTTVVAVIASASGTFSSVTQAFPNTFTNGDSVNIKFSVPVVGWLETQGAPLLVGSVTSNTSGLLRTEYAQVTVSNSAAAIVSQSGSWLSVANGAGAGLTTGTMTGFSGVPSCSCTLVGAASTSASWCGWTAEPTTTNLSITRTRAGAAENGDINILCTGPR